jgi:DNA polymerase III sliding clamp (beta) subunit (PCNA family)
MVGIDYTKVIHAHSRSSEIAARVNRETLGKVAILSSEKYRGVRFSLSNKSLQITA